MLKKLTSYNNFFFVILGWDIIELKNNSNSFGKSIQFFYNLNDYQKSRIHSDHNH